MRRILLVLSLLAVIAMVLAATAMPAFAAGRGEGPVGHEGVEPAGPGGNQSGHEGVNPGQGLKSEQFPEQAGTPFEPCPLPLPFGGTNPKAGFENAPGGVISTAPGSPFENVNPGEQCPE